MNTTTATSSEPVLKARDANARPCKVFQDRGSADRDLLRNGDGPTVMLRADMDALPIEEMTGLPYASKIKMKDRQGNMVPNGAHVRS